jgi:hypothetical protein
MRLWLKSGACSPPGKASSPGWRPRPTSIYDPTGQLGDPTTITNTILSYEPQRMLSLQATGFPKDFPYRKGTEGTWTVIYFEELPGGRTHLRLVGLGYGDDADSRAAYAFFEKGNAWTLEQLRTKLTPQ